MTWTVVVLWLLGDGLLPTRTGFLLEAREVFQTEADCVAAIPRMAAQVVEDFHERGVLACHGLQSKPPTKPAAIPAMVATASS